MVFDGSSSALHLRGVLARRPVALAALMLLAGAQARAQTDAAPQRLAQASTAALPAVTVTATLAEQDARTAPASVTVIGREELEARNASACSTRCAARPASRSRRARWAGARRWRCAAWRASTR